MYIAPIATPMRQICRTLRRDWSVFGPPKEISGACFLLLSVALMFCMSMPSSHAQTYRIQHCLLGCPIGADSQNALLLRSIYALSYNAELKTAEWVAYEVDAGAIGIASSLSREAVPDDPAVDTLTAQDFLANEDLQYIRAQYVPLVSFAATPYWNEVNYLSNAVARSSSLSQGAWYGLDWAVRNLVNREGAVFVVAGPVYFEEVEPKRLDISRSHRIPDAFFKVIANEQGQAAAFLFPQDTAVHVHHCNLITSIEEIEAMTSLDLFPEASEPFEMSLQSVLGCF